MAEALVRMYNVGFGDCFLLEVPAPDGASRRVLIDCGSIAKASSSMADIVQTILDDTKDADGTPRIDVVICSHRHRDHVSGFADARWKQVRVREVWFPWTEDPDDTKATEIRNIQSSLALALSNHWAAQAAAAPADATIAAWREVAMNALTNDKAMTMLHSGFKPKPTHRYLWSGYENGKFSTDALPGVTVHVLGPSKDPDIIRDLDPPKGKSFMKQLGEDGRVERSFEPFGDEWPLQEEAFTWAHLKMSADDKAILKSAAEEWDPAVTAALDQAVNGTSLVLAIEIGDTVLLFPGDAQWGTWNAILEDPHRAALLDRATFLKVGHHGSHNATPKAYIADHFGDGCCAMMSTRVGSYSSIPRQPLLDALRAKTQNFARSDEPAAAPAIFTKRGELSIETRIPLGGV